MRRLWAHILIAFAALVAVFASMPALIKGVSTNNDHIRGREFTFQLTERAANDEEPNPAKLTGNSAKEMANIMEGRLLASGIDSYKITTSGNGDVDDIVTVSFSADNDSQYTEIVNYLGFSGSFALMNNQDTVITEEEFFNGNAYLKKSEVNEYPTVILPIKNNYEKWNTFLDEALNNPITEAAQSEDEEAKSYSRIWLIYNFEKEDTYSKLVDLKKLEEKTLYYFDFTTLDELFADDSTKSTLRYVSGYRDTNGNGMADPSEVRAAYNTADYYLNLFNADALKFEVKCIRGLNEYKVWVEPQSEYIIKNDKINWNATLTAAIAAFVIISLLMVVFYRLGALSAVTTTLVTVFLTILFMVSTTLTYNIYALVGIVLVAASSILSSIVYLNKLKEDSYRGHTLKKANIEASKRSLLPIIDINVVTIVIGLLTYLLGGTAFHTFGSLVLFGGFISLIINTLGLKGLMWLPTNATGLIGKYQFFGINPENVPNHLAEEKQRYFGAYADKDFTKKKKPVGIFAACLFALSLAGSIVAVSLNGGQAFKSPASKVAATSQIYISNKVDTDHLDDKLNENKIKDELLTVIEVQKADESWVNLEEFVASTDYVNYEVNSSETVEGTTTSYVTVYYVINLKKDINESSKARWAGIIDEGTLKDVLGVYTTDLTYSNSASIKTVTTHVNAPDSSLGQITLAVSVSVLALTIYFMLRYKLSRGLSTLLFPAIGVSTSIGLIALLSVIGVAVPASINAALPLVTFLAYVFMITIMSKEKEMVAEDKSRDNSFEHRVELSKRSLSIAATPLLASAVIGIYLLINFFGFGAASASYIYLVAILASLITLALIIVLYVPVSNLLYKWFSNIHIEIKPRNKKEKKQVKKSAEPEEAIFIGIND